VRVVIDPTVFVAALAFPGGDAGQAIATMIEGGDCLLIHPEGEGPSLASHFLPRPRARLIGVTLLACFALGAVVANRAHASMSVRRRSNRSPRW
jgi:hypothetical protein